MKKVLIILLFAGLLFSCSKHDTDEIQSEIITYADDSYIRGTESAMTINFSFEYITSMSSDEALKLVQDSIMAYTFDAPYSLMEPRDAMEALSDTLIQEYIILNKDYSADAISEEDIVANTFSAEYVLNTGIKNIGDKVLSYEINRYVYYGGAHGSTVTKYLNFCIETGALLHEKDLFVENYEAKLTNMLVEQLLSQLKMTSAQELVDALYDLNEIRPNDNFYMDETGMTWYYNTYDIAPYFIGTTAITLSYQQLAEIIKECED